ncbi:hypothetical protein [Alkalibacillus haloalkaliphilus]|uniref:hypothetical protein n=1 Tax=Alkalibacillus haloalkaliphilus TaxID=94136 RepID=UPI002935B1C5|nr:hypothetical protein [Alkalibacillus haloalkaliphilus]MDV2581958.1 hypothetical protein [Alkalibacillus haloalkaliphilus]
MYKKLILAAVLAVVTILAACGDDRSDKEVVVDAFNSMLEAESYESTSELDFELNGNMNDPMFDQASAMLNDFDFKVDQVYDANQQLQEAVIHFSGSMPPLTLDVEVPFLQNLETQTMYIQTDSIVENLGMFFPLPEEAAGKLLEINLDDFEGEAPEFDQHEMEQKMQQLLADFFEQKDESDFSSDGDEYTVSFNEDDFLYLVEGFMNEFNDLFTDEELAMVEQDLDEAVAELSEVMNIEQLDFSVVVDGDQLEQDSFVMDLLLEDPDSDESVKIYLAGNTTYSNFNEDVEFTIDPENEEILDFEELEQMMMDAMMQGF